MCCEYRRYQAAERDRRKDNCDWIINKEIAGWKGNNMHVNKKGLPTKTPSTLSSSCAKILRPKHRIKTTVVNTKLPTNTKLSRRNINFHKVNCSLDSRTAGLIVDFMVIVVFCDPIGSMKSNSSWLFIVIGKSDSLWGRSAFFLLPSIMTAFGNASVLSISKDGNLWTLFKQSIDQRSVYILLEDIVGLIVLMRNFHNQILWVSIIRKNDPTF